MGDVGRVDSEDDDDDDDDDRRLTFFRSSAIFLSDLPLEISFCCFFC